MRKYSILLLKLLFICLSSCVSEKRTEDKLLEFDTLTLRYHKPMKEGDWLEIDKIKFFHKLVDTTGVIGGEDIMNSLNIHLPTTENYTKLEGYGFYLGDDFSNYQMAAIFLRSLEKYEQQNLKDGKDVVYRFVGSEYEVYEGKIRLTRNDSYKIRVRYSEGYNSIVRD